jgi:Niemann-Pick C1 protein
MKIIINAAHVGLAFLMSTGSKDVRATNALRDIGPAVLNGGFSTFLGIVFLANSETYALQAFFKVR